VINEPKIVKIEFITASGQANIEIYLILLIIDGISKDEPGIPEENKNDAACIVANII
jgi:hypothetical protein